MDRSRLASLLATVFDTSFGTVWRVSEAVWKESFRHMRYESTRTWHPGLSLNRQKSTTALYEYVPMLHGTSGGSGPVVVRGLTREKGPHYETSFGRILRPARVAMREIALPSKDRPEHLEIFPFEGRRVCENLYKPRLDRDEQERLRQWARARKLL